MIALRDYQQNALDSIFTYYYSGKKGNPLVVAPTGSGKSIIIAGFCREVRSRWPEQKILVISHVKEILTQNRKAIKDQIPEESIGVWSAGLKRKDLAPITVASVQSAYNEAELFRDNFDVVVVDECHLIPHKGQGRYRTLLNLWDKPTIGFTATPFRLGTGFLHCGEGAMFEEIVYNISIKHLIAQGHLCPIAAKGPAMQLDPTNIKKSGGDYVVKELSHQFNRAAITHKIVDELMLYKDLRKKWLLFAIDIDHAEQISSILNERGIITKAVHSRMSSKERDEVLVAFKTQTQLQALVSVAVLTTGFDAPEVDMIGLLRPTASPVLHVQIIGRGLRPAPDKKDCLILDFAGNLMRNGPIDSPEVRVAGTNPNAEPIMKRCDQCFEIVHAAVRVCPVCEFKFQFRAALTATAGDGTVLSGEEWHNVTRVEYSDYTARSGYRMLKVTYQCGLREFSEYIGVEHPGYTRHKAAYWWERRSNNGSLPGTVVEAMEKVDKLKVPIRIFVNEGGKYPSITKQEF